MASALMDAMEIAGVRDPHDVVSALERAKISWNDLIQRYQQNVSGGLTITG